MNPAGIMKLMNMRATFKKNHPKFASFLTDVVGRGLEEGTILEITVQRPGEEKICTNMRVTGEDLELIRQLKEMQG